MSMEFEIVILRVTKKSQLEREERREEPFKEISLEEQDSFCCLVWCSKLGYKARLSKGYSSHHHRTRSKMLI